MECCFLLKNRLAVCLRSFWNLTKFTRDDILITFLFVKLCVFVIQFVNTSFYINFNFLRIVNSMYIYNSYHSAANSSVELCSSRELFLRKADWHAAFVLRLFQGKAPSMLMPFVLRLAFIKQKISKKTHYQIFNSNSQFFFKVFCTHLSFSKSVLLPHITIGTVSTCFTRRIWFHKKQK